MVIKPREYQLKAVEASEKALKDGISTQMIVLPTGGGKSYTACKIAEKFNKVLWITHTEELIEQSGMALLLNVIPYKYHKDVKETISSHGGLIETLNYIEKNPMFSSFEEYAMITKNIGVIKQNRMDVKAHIIVASIQTIHRRLNNMDPGMFDLMIVDECHLAASRTFVKTMDHFKTRLRTGLTATPNRSDNLGLSHIFEKIVYEYSIKDAIEEGYLVEIDAIRVQTDISLDNVRTTAGELNQSDLKLVNSPKRNNLVVDKYEQYVKGKQGIIFCVDVDHAVKVAETFAARGHKSINYIVGDTELSPERKNVINSFKNGKLQILTNCMILTAGFDHPGIEWIGMACPTKSLTKYLQQIGRGTRALTGVLKPGMDINERRNAIASSKKPKLTILDFVDVTSKHKLINAWELDKEKEPEDRIFITREKKEKLREARKSKIDRLTDKDEHVKLMDLPPWKNVATPHLAATDKQLEVLKDFGYDTGNTYYSRADASMIISSQPIRSWQVKKLKEWGYKADQTTTYGQYSMINKKMEEEQQKKIRNVKQQIQKVFTFNDVKNEGEAF